MDLLHDTLLLLHMVAGTVGIIVGAWAIWISRDRPVLDGRAVAYHWTVAVVALTSAGLVALDWSALWWLLPVAALSYALAAAGLIAPRRRFAGWRAAYVHGQGGSYVALVTALLVVSLTVDGPIHGPLVAVVWGLPTLIGTVLIRSWHRRLTHEAQPSGADRHRRAARVTPGRARLPTVAVCVGFALVAWLSTLVPTWLGWLAFAVGIAVYTRVGGPPERAPIRLRAPVTGRWRAANSPADRVPSHGLHAYGQSFALDLVHEPEAARRPLIGWWPPARRPERYPGFGREVCAPAAGVVVRTHDGERDHWSRSSYVGLIWLLVEAGIRELTGPGRIFGNHIVLDLGRGRYAALAHLKRESLEVRPGERVVAGQRIARCGNSGNSSEPHLHLQCMDDANLLLADGIPFTFEDRDTAGGRGLPSRSARWTFG